MVAARVSGDPVATITVSPDVDPDFWSLADARETALYVNRMLVRRAWSGTSLGGRMLDWASRRGERQGKQWLRLDAWRSNKGLQDYYLAQGFRLVRVMGLSWRQFGALFQRRTGVVRLPDRLIGSV